MLIFTLFFTQYTHPYTYSAEKIVCVCASICVLNLLYSQFYAMNCKEYSPVSSKFNQLQFVLKFKRNKGDGDVALRS